MYGPYHPVLPGREEEGSSIGEELLQDYYCSIVTKVIAFHIALHCFFSKIIKRSRILRQDDLLQPGKKISKNFSFHQG